MNSRLDDMMNSVEAAIDLQGVLVEWMKDNLEPDDIFTDSQLEQWSEKNGYTKEESKVKPTDEPMENMADMLFSKYKKVESIIIGLKLLKNEINRRLEPNTYNDHMQYVKNEIQNILDAFYDSRDGGKNIS